MNTDNLSTTAKQLLQTAILSQENDFESKSEYLFSYLTTYKLTYAEFSESICELANLRFELERGLIK